MCDHLMRWTFSTCAHNSHSRFLPLYTHHVHTDEQNMIFVPKDPDREERARRKSSAHAHNAQVISQLAATRQQMDVAIALAQRRRSSTTHATDSELLSDLPNRSRKHSSRRASGAGDRSAGSATGDTSATSVCTPSTPAKKGGSGFWANLFGRSSARGRTQSAGGGGGRRQKRQATTTMSTGLHKMNRRNKNAGNTTVRSKSAEAIVEVCHVCEQCLHNSI